MKLTNATVGTLPAKGADTLYADDGCPNLYVRIRAGGSRSYVVQWRQNGLQRRVTIGKASHLTLTEARQRARKMLVNISDGYDPQAAKAKFRIDDKQIFETLAREYLEVRSRDMRARSLEQCRLHLLTYFLPLHKLPLKKLDRATVAVELRAIVTVGWLPPIAAEVRFQVSSAGRSAKAFWKTTSWSARTGKARAQAVSACSPTPSLPRSGTLCQARTLARSSSC